MYSDRKQISGGLGWEIQGEEAERGHIRSKSKLVEVIVVTVT